jgi:hypothetical protein
MPSNYEGSFSASYDPNLRTTSSFSGPGVQMEGLGGGFDLDALINKIARLKRRSQPKAPSAPQRGNYRGGPAIQSRATAPPNPLGQFDAARQYMDQLESPLDRYTMGNSPLGSNFRNFVGASQLSGIGGGFPNDWIKMYQDARVNPLAQDQAEYMRSGGGR